MATKFNKRVAALGVSVGLALGVAGCGQFAPSYDVRSISAAVKQAVVEHNDGTAKLDCRFDPEHSISGVSVGWSNSRGDSGYVCVAGVSTSVNVYNDLGGSASQSVQPFYPVAYYNIIGNTANKVTYGAAVISGKDTLLIQINNGISETNSTQTIAKIEVPGLNTDPFAVAKRK